MADAIRLFPSLERLTLVRGAGNEFAEFLERLAMMPHALRLRQLVITLSWTDRIAHALTHVPTITEIGGRFRSVSSLHFLTSFTQLRSLALDTLDSERHSSASGRVSHRAAPTDSLERRGAIV